MASASCHDENISQVHESNIWLHFCLSAYQWSTLHEMLQEGDRMSAQATHRISCDPSVMLCTATTQPHVECMSHSGCSADPSILPPQHTFLNPLHLIFPFPAEFVKLLHLLDIPVTAETVQGSGSYKERATFLHSLVQLVTATQELLQPSDATHSPQATPIASHNSQPHSHPHGDDGQGSASQSQSQLPLGREMRVLELACERVGALTQESAQLLPVHVTQALQPLL